MLTRLSSHTRSTPAIKSRDGRPKMFALVVRAYSHEDVQVCFQSQANPVGDVDIGTIIPTIQQGGGLLIQLCLLGWHCFVQYWPVQAVETR